MNRSFPTRALVAAVTALLLSLAALSATTAPASADGNEGGTAVNPASRAQQARISAGDGHTCAVIGTTSTVWCWGDNTFGQLGNGTTTSSTTPVKVVGLSGVIAVSAGGQHTCALLADGAPRCWGRNSFGQLGIGMSVAVSAVPVTPNGPPSYTGIAAGHSFTCAMTPGQVWCWGRGTEGQLGNGGFANLPFAVTVGLPGPPKVVTAGNQHACAALQSGQAFCWGQNTNGQLGLGFTSGPQPNPSQPSLGSVDAISAGSFHTCALAPGGTRCWGLNSDGQLGTGSFATVPLPTPVANPNSSEQAISAGALHTCSRASSQLRCWGRNQEGQRGVPNLGDTSVPTAVPAYTGEIPAVTTGASHTCVQFGSGRVDCFGWNFHGQLGNGSTTNTATPARVLDVPGVPGVTSVRPGDGTLSLSWTAPSSAGVPLQGYRLRDLNSSLDVSLPAGTTSHTLTGLTPGQTYELALSAVNEVGEGQPNVRAPITLSTLPYVEVSDASYAEGDSGTKTMTFTITRFGKTTTALSVKAATQNGDPAVVPAAATAPGDYTAKAATLISFAAGQTSKTFTVSTKGDLLAEDDESFHVVLSGPSGAEIWDGLGVGTLTNDDPGGKPHYAISSESVSEGNTGTKYLTFTITRGGSTAVAGSVQYFTQTIAGGATANTDFTPKAATLMSFPVGVTSKTFTVAIRGDYVAEGDESFQVGLKAAVNGDLPAFPFGYGTIVNDDSSATPSISIGDVSIAEGNSFTKNVTFTVTRSGNLAGTTAFKYATQNGTAIAPGDYAAKALTSLSFTAGQSSKTLTVTIKGDTVPEPDEMFTVVLSAATGGTIGDGSGTGTIVNDD